ncbi:hypothetical protein QQX09_00625 [Demequina sp. SYSU T00192]|uniref:Histone acetyltransferase Rv0428c-like SH3 domain-containing protein n=1 Tax=Demequina litoralis TaxID=3051660 RepID=A0ABT8G5D9_9MICO|nr:hypothetical protein [Demequina sp. SYSU T00192]MDN4474351.1 hypothetical protein [Demequina sp. SYSU T00192]
MIRLPAPGRRVVVRYLLPTGQATDALGTLLSADAEAVVVETRRGTVRVAGDAIVAAKEVPPAPPRRAPRATADGRPADS